MTEGKKGRERVEEGKEGRERGGNGKTGWGKGTANVSFVSLSFFHAFFPLFSCSFCRLPCATSPHTNVLHFRSHPFPTFLFPRFFFLSVIFLCSSFSYSTHLVLPCLYPLHPLSHLFPSFLLSFLRLFSSFPFHSFLFFFFMYSAPHFCSFPLLFFPFFPSAVLSFLISFLHSSFPSIYRSFPRIHSCSFPSFIILSILSLPLSFNVMSNFFLCLISLPPPVYSPFVAIPIHSLHSSFFPSLLPYIFTSIFIPLFLFFHILYVHSFHKFIFRTTSYPHS